MNTDKLFDGLFSLTDTVESLIDKIEILEERVAELEDRQKTYPVPPSSGSPLRPYARPPTIDTTPNQIGDKWWWYP